MSGSSKDDNYDMFALNSSEYSHLPTLGLNYQINTPDNTTPLMKEIQEYVKETRNEINSKEYNVKYGTNDVDETESVSDNHDLLFKITDEYLETKNNKDFSRFNGGFISNGSNRVIKYHHVFVYAIIPVEKRMDVLQQIEEYSDELYGGQVDFVDLVEDNHNPFMIVINLVIKQKETYVNSGKYLLKDCKEDLIKLIQPFSNEKVTFYSLEPE